MNADQNRDRQLEGALERELRAAAIAPPGDSCLDAETLAAWTDGGLDASAVAMAEAHVSSCARCQALVGTLAHAIPSDAPSTDAVSARLWRWWFAPLAASAAAVTLWMVVPQQQYSAPPPAPLAAAPAEAVAPAALDAPAAPAAPADQVNTPPAERGRDLAVTTSDRQEFAGLKRKAEAPKELGKLAEAGARPEARADAAAQAPAAPAITERRSNAEVEPPPDAPVTARSSPSPGVVWFVGRGGLVLLTVDGRTFTRVPFPETADLSAVTATDARIAMVTTVDGRTFRTDDGGKTWRRLQEIAAAPF